MAARNDKQDTKGMTVSKSDDISSWYTEVIQKAEMADYTSVSGCIVFRPDAYAVWEKVQRAVDEKIRRMGVRNAYFPLFIPEKLLKKEEDHVEGFSAEVAWVTHAGDTKLDERLAVRPTSETIMYESYSRWIRSWRDLPLKINQWNNVVRWEFKHAVPFLRTREFLWNEGHTVFADKKEAEEECIQILDMYEEILRDHFALYGMKSKKTEKEKFAGAEYTLSIEHYLPNGRAIQGPDAHHDGQNFAKAFDIKYLDKDGQSHYAYQNTWAITTRMIGVMIMMHGDDKGLVLPPRLAPVQAVIVPIYFKEKEKVLKEARKIKDMLDGISVKLDDRDGYTPGWKYNEWELKGVPLRVEIGPRDIKNKQVMVVRRDTGERYTVKASELKEQIISILEQIHQNLYGRSRQLFVDAVKEPSTWEEFASLFSDGKSCIAKVPFCNTPSCEDEIKAQLQGVKSIGIPIGDKPRSDRCIRCGKPSKAVVQFSRSY